MSYTGQVNQPEVKRPVMRTTRRPSKYVRGFGPSLKVLIVVLFALSLSLVPVSAQGTGAGEQPAVNLSPSIRVSPGTDLLPQMEVRLDASASTHLVPDDLVDEIRYMWDMGDGTVRIGEQITHQYVMSGVFTATLTMEIFESTGIFHRGTTSTEITVGIPNYSGFMTVVNLETGFTLTGNYAVLIPSEGDVHTIDEPDDKQEGSSGSNDPPHNKLDLERLILSGGVIPIGELRMWNAMLAMDLASDQWLGFVGVGTNLSESSISLTSLYPVVGNAGYELTAVLEKATLIALGVGYELTSNVYLLGSLGSLHVEGTFEGSSRLTLDSHLLPDRFASRRTTLSFGLGLRISGWFMLSVQALLML